MVTTWRILVRRGLFFIIGAVLVVGQVVAQDRGAAETEFECVRSQVNPDNDTPDFSSAVSDNYVVWSGMAEGEGIEI